MQSLTRSARHVALLNRAGATNPRYNASIRISSTARQASTSQPAPKKSFRPSHSAAVLAWTAAFGIAFYSAQLVVAARKPCTNPQISELAQQTDVAARYDDTADKFDYEVGFSEWLMGVMKM
jgi:methyltransferase OMS1